MNNKTMLFVVLSLIFGVTAVYLAQNWLQSNANPEQSVDTSNVITMATPAPLGAIIERKHLAITSVPNSLIPKGAITDIKDAEGKVVNQRLYEGEVLRSERLTKKGEGSTLASLIAPTMRAVTIRVNDVVGVAGFLLPGNRVDIINIYKKNGLKTDIVLSNVKILAIDQRASSDENKPKVVRAVTLELSLEQAETLMIAKGRGSLQLALRNPNDEAVVELAKLTETPTKVVESAKKQPKPIEQVVRVATQAKTKIYLLKGMNEQVIKVSH